MKPVIAMPQMGHDPFREYMKGKYVKSLKMAGAQVQWIELDDPVKAAKQALEWDGLLLPGGQDVNPLRYGQEAIEACGPFHEVRDAGEIAILQEFILTGKPVLGICRGCQLMNVALGGTLIQDIKPIQQVNHRDFPNRARGTHHVSLEPGSRLYRILGTRITKVNSLHHQVVDKTGAGLTVTARSPEGFAEAVEHGNHPFCVGVQWHPEHMNRLNLTQRKIFKAFVNACK